MLTCRQRLELMRHVYNEDSSPSTPEAKEDIFECLTVYSNPKFSLANLLPSRLVLERARLSPLHIKRHVNTKLIMPGRLEESFTDAKQSFFTAALPVLKGFLDTYIHTYIWRRFLAATIIIKKNERALHFGARRKLVSVDLHGFWTRSIIRRSDDRTNTMTALAEISAIGRYAAPLLLLLLL